jgi:hypothetical protein
MLMPLYERSSILLTHGCSLSCWNSQGPKKPSSEQSLSHEEQADTASLDVVEHYKRLPGALSPLFPNLSPSYPYSFPVIYLKLQHHLKSNFLIRSMTLDSFSSYLGAASTSSEYDESLSRRFGPGGSRFRPTRVTIEEPEAENTPKLRAQYRRALKRALEASADAQRPQRPQPTQRPQQEISPFVNYRQLVWDAPLGATPPRLTDLMVTDVMSNSKYNPDGRQPSTFNRSDPIARVVELTIRRMTRCPSIILPEQFLPAEEAGAAETEWLPPYLSAIVSPPAYNGVLQEISTEPPRWTSQPDFNGSAYLRVLY